MPLMTTRPMFDLAYDGGFAVGEFNVNNMELAQSIIDACAESSPLILQISKGEIRQYSLSQAHHRRRRRRSPRTPHRHPLRSRRHRRSHPAMHQ